ncbi:MAG: nitronate monooxygenase [Hyphomicrobiaceae bacterium]
MKHREFFGCRHPILSVAMNRVSDVALAVAIHEAGAFPSISSFNFHRNGVLDFAWFESELDRFCDLTGSTDVLLSLSTADFLTTRIEMLARRGFRFVELFNWYPDERLWSETRARMAFLRRWYDIRTIFKIHRASDAIELDLPTVVFKGNEGAGRTVVDAGSLEENFQRLRQARPDMGIIPSGGISTADEVRHYMNHGALAVGIGTLFAASEESCVSRETKQRMIEAGAADIRRFGRFNHRGLMFGGVGNDDDNNTRSLVQGIADPAAGSIFVGGGIDRVTAIRPVRDIVAMLVELLPEPDSPDPKRSAV